MAHQQLAATTSSLTGSQRAAVSDAVKLAELWLDPATDFPAGRHRGEGLVGDRVGGREPADVAAAVRPGGRAGATAWVEGLPEEVRARPGR